MKTNDQNLEATVTRWHADAEPPAALRTRVLEKATGTTTPVLHSPRVNRRRIWWATGAAMAASAASVALVATISTPARPAFADVQKAMTQIKTVQWDSEFSSYETATKKAGRFTNHQAARLNPPALYTKYPGGSVTVATPEWEYSRGVGKNKSTGKTVTRVRRYKRFQWKKDPVADLRYQIEMQIFSPESPMAKNPSATTMTTIVENGQTLLRFDSRLGKGRDLRKRLTRPGYHFTVWADPITRRMVRTRREYYDGTRHNIATYKNFRYDESLPDSLFDGEALMASAEK